MTPTLTPTSREFLDLAATGRPRPAIDFVLEKAAGGQPLDSIIVDVLVPTQVEVGRRWQANVWSVAQEHAATAVVDGVLGAVGLQIPARPTPRGTVLVACVEQEYHSVPARMGVERLRSDGWDVSFLGASLPAQDLQSFVASAEPDAVVLSCTIPLFLPGAARCIAAVADLGLPAVAAGAGFGETSARADRLGASGWIGAGKDPSAVLCGALRPAGPAEGPDAEAVQLEQATEDLVAACMAKLFSSIPEMSSYSERQLAHTRADLRYTLRYLGVALDLDEPELFVDFVRWLAEVLGSRGLPPAVLRTSLDIVAGAVGEAGFARSAALCSSGRERL